ncbi:NUDIX domain-containing protein [archaeon]|jgi:8-oxo-dGTP diphosphatase|nr:NUDIX domain-containing protein [archaeon]
MQRGKVASVVFVNNDKKILLHLRDDKPDIQSPNTWGFIGGHIDEGESVSDALKREVKEEINFDVKNPVLVTKFDDCVGNDVVVYLAKIDSRLDELELNEGQKIEFFSFDEIMKLDRVPKVIIDFLNEFKEKIFE